MKDPRALHAMLNWDRANPVAKMYLAAIKEGVEIRHCRVPTLGIWSAGDAYLWEDQIKESSKLMAAPWGYVRLDQGYHWPQRSEERRVGQECVSTYRFQGETYH